MTTFYVNGKSSRAADSNPGTSALNPLRTIGQASLLAANNDRVLVYPATYPGPITPTVNGVSWEAVAPGVVVDGSSTLLQTWTLHSGTVYKCTFGGSALQNLYVDGELYSFPAATLATVIPLYEPVTHITEAAFFHDTATSTLYLDLGGSNPAAHAIRYGSRASCFRFLSVTDHVLTGFKLMRSNAQGVLIDGGGRHVIRGNELWQNPAGGVRVQGAKPSLFVPTVVAGTSTLGAGTYTYRVTAVVGGVETAPSNYQQITITASQLIRLSWAAVIGASEYRIYGRSAIGPPTQPTGTYMATVVSAAPFPTYDDNGSTTPTGTSPPFTTTVKSYDNLVDDNHCWQNGSYAIILFNCADNTVRGNRCHHNALTGVGLQSDASDNVIEENHCWLNKKGPTRSANGVTCDNFGAGTPGAPRNIIQRNWLHSNQDSGISIYNGSTDCIVRYNLVYLNGDHGVDNFNAERCHMSNNTAIGNLTAGLNSEGGGSGGGSPSLGIRMYNNVSVDNGINSPRTTGNYRIDNFTMVDSEFDYNLSYLTVPAASQPGPGANAEIVYGLINYPTYAAFRAANPTVMTHGVSANPLFADAHYRLDELSPALGTGTSLAPDYDAPDFNGRTPLANPSMGVHHSAAAATYTTQEDLPFFGVGLLFLASSDT